MTLVLYDSIDPSQIPASAVAVAGYTSGNWPTFATLQQKFPHAHLLSIAISASEDADVLDIENGDATPAQAPAWVKRQHARGIARPVLYASASIMGEVIAALLEAGIARSSVRLWAAHYGLGEHVCGTTCGYPSADGTQWTDRALGRNLDQSAVNDGFFAAAPAPATEEDSNMTAVIWWDGHWLEFWVGPDGKVSVYRDNVLTGQIPGAVVKGSLSGAADSKGNILLNAKGLDDAAWKLWQSAGSGTWTVTKVPGTVLA